MITEFLLEHRWLSPAVLVTLVLGGPLAGMWLVERPRLAWWAAGASLLPVAALTLVPVDRQLFGRCAVQWALPTPNRVELMANLVLFVAPVLFAGVAARRPVAALVAGVCLSAAIEVVQAAVIAIGRSCDTGDLLANSMGAVIGALLAWLSLASHDRRVQPADSLPVP